MPHTASDQASSPLLDFRDLPRFEDIGPEHVGPAMDALLDEARELIASLALTEAAAATWDSVIAPLEDIGNRLDRAWSPVGHLNAVMDTPALREAYNAALAKLTAFHAEMGQNESLYNAYQHIANSDEYTRLDAAGRKTVDNALRDFNLAGVALEPDAKERFKTNETRLSALSSQFKENVLDATTAWQKLVAEESALEGVPASSLQVAAEAAARNDKKGWLLTLDAPCYIAIVTYARDRSLRRELYEAYVTRASDSGPHAERFDNTQTMAEILALRHEQALAVGYSNYAELSLAKKMAPSTDEVVRFLRDLAARAKPRAQAELDEIRDFARETDGLTDIEAWDLPYYAEKLRVERYDISQEELRAYFPAPRAIEGLFAVASRLYGITIENKAPVQLWHPDVQFFEIRDTETGETLGRFYLDLYARPHKRGGAWMDECIVRKRVICLRSALNLACASALSLTCTNLHTLQRRRSRSPTSPATSHPRSRAARRCSRTTRSPRSFTSSVMACITCSRASTGLRSRAFAAYRGMQSSCRASSWRTGVTSARRWRCSQAITKPANPCRTR